uniref:fructose-bisphosphate aldolase n=1 Tax=Zea mays TaxID=4577 RepID=A0A804NV88_MAIZE
MSQMQHVERGYHLLETLYKSTTDGKKFVDCLKDQNIMSGIKVDKGLVPLPGSNNESWCQGLDGLASSCYDYRLSTAGLMSFVRMVCQC